MILKNQIIQQLNVTTANTANDNLFGEKKFKKKKQCSIINCVLNINGVKIDNADDLDHVTSMYNLLEHSKNYRKTTGSLPNYYRDEPNSRTDANNITQSILNSKAFDYKANFIEDGITQNNLTKHDVKFVVPLKHFFQVIFGKI